MKKKKSKKRLSADIKPADLKPDGAKAGDTPVPAFATVDAGKVEAESGNIKQTETLKEVPGSDIDAKPESVVKNTPKAEHVNSSANRTEKDSVCGPKMDLTTKILICVFAALMLIIIFGNKLQLDGFP